MTRADQKSIRSIFSDRAIRSIFVYSMQTSYSLHTFSSVYPIIRTELSKQAASKAGKSVTAAAQI